MLTQKLLRLFLSILIILPFLNACGGGGGGGGKDNSPPSRQSGTISGVVFDAPVTGAKVEAWEFKGGRLGRKLGEAKTDARGHYTMSVTSGSMPVTLIASGGAYKDPFTSKIIESSVGSEILRFESVVNFKEGKNQNVMITPLTYLAAGLIKFKGNISSSGIDESNALVGEMYGFDILSTEPIDPINGPQSSAATDGYKYGMLLTAYSALACDRMLQSCENNNDGVYTSANLSSIQYRDILADGKLDGKAISQQNQIEELYFGKWAVSPSLYTNTLAKYMLISANKPSINQVGVPADRFNQFAEVLRVMNDSRFIDNPSPESVDAIPPKITAEKENVILSGFGMIDIDLTDDIAVMTPKVILSYKDLSGNINELDNCNSGSELNDSFCWLNLEEFEQGERSTTVKLFINTVKLDDEFNDDQKPANPPKVDFSISVEDALGNEQTLTQSISWNNKKPIIENNSANTIQPNASGDYSLLGYVSSPFDEIKEFSVTINGKKPENIESPTCEDDGSGVYKCNFNIVSLLKSILARIQIPS